MSPLTKRERWGRFGVLLVCVEPNSYMLMESFPLSILLQLLLSLVFVCTSLHSFLGSTNLYQFVYSFSYVNRFN